MRALLRSVVVIGAALTGGAVVLWSSAGTTMPCGQRARPYCFEY